VVIGPGLFEAMGEFLHGLIALWAPEDDSDAGSTEAGEHPEKIFHLRRLLCSDSWQVPGFG
jgi:hypothetical protein